MSDLIKRSDAIKALKREKSDWNNDYNVPIDNCIERLNKVKSADRPQGEWKNHKDEHYCTNCGEVVIGDWYDEDDWYTYCPNCGADMREREGE